MPVVNRCVIIGDAMRVGNGSVIPLVNKCVTEMECSNRVCRTQLVIRIKKERYPGNLSTTLFLKAKETANGW